MKTLITASLSVLVLITFSAVVSADDHHAAPGVAPADAVKQLQEGNARYVAGKAEHPHSQTDRAKETAEHGQHPIVTILSCGDSRVPLEVVFDQGIGDIFSVRVAGNVATDGGVLGSLEYGVAHAGSKLVVVLGHTKCGAITAACTGGGHEGNIESLMQGVKPAVERIVQTTGKTGKDIIEQTCLANVYLQIENIYSKSEILREAVKKDEAQIIGAIYNIETGAVEFYGEHPNTKKLLDIQTTVEQAPPTLKTASAAAPISIVSLPPNEEVHLDVEHKAEAKPVVAGQQAESRPGSFRTFLQKKGTLFGR